MRKFRVEIEGNITGEKFFAANIGAAADATDEEFDHLVDKLVDELASQDYDEWDRKTEENNPMGRSTRLLNVKTCYTTEVWTNDCEPDYVFARNADGDLVIKDHDAEEQITA